MYASSQRRCCPFTSLGAIALFAACSSGSDTAGPEETPEAIPVSVTGQVVDFESQMPLESATVSVGGIIPAPSVEVTGPEFTIRGVPPFSSFHLLVGSPPSHVSTYNAATVVEDEDVQAAPQYALRAEYAAALSASFGVQNASGGVLLARAVDANGDAVEGIPAGAFSLTGTNSLSGPFFLDAARSPNPALQQTSASGYAVFFELDPGVVTIAAASGSSYTMQGEASPVAANVITLAEVTVETGEKEAEAPVNVQFARDVVPIFEARGCIVCHSGNGIGRDLGNLTLTASANLIFKELTQELSPNARTTRVNTAMPEASLVLTMPSLESPADRHPNVTFAGPSDPDYQTILAWIQAGALR